MYGIDLGTTNSLIGENGQLLTDLVRSSVDLETMTQEDDMHNPNIYASYKKSMTIGKNGEDPIKASSVILKKLVGIANLKTGKECYDVIISVPAKFSSLQRQAVREAAEMADLNLKGIINEPTAAAILACKRNNATLFVIDVGGGTTDMSIVDSCSSTCEVYASDGRLIGGDDLDDEILNMIYKDLNPRILLKSKGKVDMKLNICKAKESWREDTQEMIIDCSPIEKGYWTLTKEKYLQAIDNVFGTTIDIALNLLNECKGISRSDLKILFVGGSCKNPLLTKYYLDALGMVEYEFREDKDRAVAQGVSLYAELFERDNFQEIVKDTAHRLFIANDDYAEELIKRATFLPAEGSIVINNKYVTDHIDIEFFQGDNIDKNDPGTSYIGKMEFYYDRVMQPGEGPVLLKVLEDRDSMLRITATDLITNMEQEITLRI